MAALLRSSTTLDARMRSAEFPLDGQATSGEDAINTRYTPDILETPSITPSSSSGLATHRLLYRGALSLPDSHILLDGLSFTAALTATGEIANIADGNGTALLDHPLALALESMRGRPSLHLIGMVKLADVWIDEKSVGAVTLDIHPLATLSKLYFENAFCLEPITAADSRSEHGVRVSLSDSDDPSNNDILIYAQLQASPSASTDSSSLDIPSTSSSPAGTLSLLAARILPGPPPARAPPRPRPDDPTPRLPPFAKRKRDESLSGHADDRKAKASRGKGRETEVSAETLRRARETMTTLPRSAAGTGIKGGRGGEGGKAGKGGGFKVPQVPARRGSGSADLREGSAGTDVSMIDAFGASQQPEPADTSPEGREKANKTVVKQAVVRCLGDYGISKQHEEFNDLFQYTYRGTSFALVRMQICGQSLTIVSRLLQPQRTQMRTAALDLWSVYRLVDTHAKMYIEGPSGAGQSRVTAGR
ncbi:hypothetical protein WOLCODRAFT_126226 [Wolfiporia cocos MD-104 SS10]|uniref:Sld7 C-terminal domain-containing protein n=1 Tax=Wolfiporia cocos (strain MD-104) TaxID=742152 RepID=A0A2H3JAF2_WOLCO|nr:hypothetical protein WOLCODRAFT_126226 [Wolfiporia cocos MD-104 SS10]